MFGTQRVEALLRDAAGAGHSADAIIAQLRLAVERFLAGAAAEDDQTAIIIRRL